MIYLFILKITLIITLLSLLLYYYYYNKKHNFWDHQPVSRKYSKSGILSLTKTKVLNKTNFVFKSLLDIDNFTYFINENYIDGYEYSNKVIKKILNNGKIYGLYTKDKLVGSISSQLFSLHFLGKKLDIQYVDFLCVDKNHRNKNLAPVLISNLVAKNFRNTTFLFKKDNKKLPFDHLCQFNYYMLDIKYQKTLDIPFSINHLLLDLENLSLAFERYNNFSSQFDITVTFNKQRFYEYFKSNDDNLFTYLVYEGSKYIGLYSFYIININFFGIKHKVAEIILLMWDKDIFKYIVSKLKDLNINYILISDLADNKKIISKNNFIQGNKCFIQLYNYGTKSELSTHQINLPLF